jgi:hypothetical protein
MVLTMAEYIERTEELMLAMNAGARAIENTRRYHGVVYTKDVFSESTQADVDKAYSNGIVEGLSRGIDLMLYVLIDKHDAPMDDVQQLAGELNHAAQCVAEGYVTWADIRQMLKEYGVETALE